MSPAQLTLSRFALRGNALAAAETLLEEHPDAEITSGLRSREEQADAMAENIVVAGRQWIAETYADSAPARACQRWIDEHPDVITKAGISIGLLSVLERFTDDELAHLSKHFTGLAFDVKPLVDKDGNHTGAGRVLVAAIRRIVASFGGMFLEKEGGLIRLHCQFTE